MKQMTREELHKKLNTTYDDCLLNRILMCTEDMILDDGTILVKEGAYGKCTADLPDEEEGGLFAIFFAEECLEPLHEDTRKKSWITFRPYNYISHFSEMESINE